MPVFSSSIPCRLALAENVVELLPALQRVPPWLRRSDLNAVLGTCMDLDRGVPDVQGAVVSNARIRFSRRGHEVTIDQARQLVAICLQYLDRWHGDYAFDERDLSGIGHRYAALAHRRAVRAEKGRFAGNATSQDRRGRANLASGCGPGIGWWASTELAVTWWFTSRDPPTPRVVWRRSPRCLLRRTRSTFADTARCQRWIPLRHLRVPILTMKTPHDKVVETVTAVQPRLLG